MPSNPAEREGLRILESWRNAEVRRLVNGPAMLNPEQADEAVPSVSEVLALAAPAPREGLEPGFNPLSILAGEYEAGRLIRSAVEHDAATGRFYLTCSIGELAQRLAAAPREQEPPAPGETRRKMISIEVTEYVRLLEIAGAAPTGGAARCECYTVPGITVCGRCGRRPTEAARLAEEIGVEPDELDTDPRLLSITAEVYRTGQAWLGPLLFAATDRDGGIGVWLAPGKYEFTEGEPCIASGDTATEALERAAARLLRGERA